MAKLLGSHAVAQLIDERISGAETIVKLTVDFYSRVCPGPTRIWCGECGVEFDTAEGLWSHCCQ